MTSEVDKQEFREAMSRLGAAVNIITTAGEAGQTGFSATAVCSVTDSPAMLLICLNHSASVYDTVITNGKICVNTLGAHQTDLAMRFGGKTPAAERFEGGAWRMSDLGVPVLEDAPVSLECEIDSWQDVGTHRVLFCKVRHINLSASVSGLAYFGRKFIELHSA